LTEIIAAPEFPSDDVLQLAASLERYSKHPLAAAINNAAESRQLVLHEASDVSERPGEGLRGTVEGTHVSITNRQRLMREEPQIVNRLPDMSGGLECVVLIDGRYAGTMQFRDEPRTDGISFVHHLRPKHHFQKVMLVSGDRESEVRYLADRVGIKDVYFGQSPEQKLELVRQETARANTLFMGDGINDAPALTAATVGLAFGSNSDITSEAAGAVILDTSLQKVDEFFHISRRMRTIALQSAVGGMALSFVGMLLAAVGMRPPVAGAIFQEIIDVVAVLNALRVGLSPCELTDFSELTPAN
jgi:P-type E1-E2 ATPase